MSRLRIKYEGWLTVDDGAKEPGPQEVTGAILSLAYDSNDGEWWAAVAGDDGRCYSLPFAQCTHQGASPVTTENLTEQGIESVIDHCKHRIEVHNGAGGVSAREALAMAEDMRRLREENERLARDVERWMGNAISEEKRRMEADKALTAATERAEKAEAQIKEARTAYGLDEDTADQHDISLADCIRLLRDQRDYLAEQAEKDQP